MRLLHSIANDVKFQFKYGFYLLYVIMTLMYIGILYALPQSAKNMGAALIIFSDPAALGLFFMGAIVLFEKSERVLNSLFISPLKVHEYIAGKVLSLCLISTAVAVVIAYCAGSASVKLLPLAVGVALGSVLFSLAGLIVAARISSLNQFILYSLPFELLLSAPPILFLFGFDSALLQLHPAVVMIRLIMTGVSADSANVLAMSALLLLWIVPFWIWATVSIKNMRRALGGVKL